MRLITRLAALCVALLSAFGETVYLRVDGIPGEETAKGFVGTMQVFAFTHEIVSPRDPATGLATGRRQHQPIRCVVQQGLSLPLLAQALAENKVIPKVDVSFLKPNIEGIDTVYFKYTLTNATISSIRPWMPNVKDSSTTNFGAQVEVAFTYQTIQWNSVTGAKVFEDSWSGVGP